MSWGPRPAGGTALSISGWVFIKLRVWSESAVESVGHSCSHNTTQYTYEQHRAEYTQFWYSRDRQKMRRSQPLQDEVEVCPRLWQATTLTAECVAREMHPQNCARRHSFETHTLLTQACCSWWRNEQKTMLQFYRRTGDKMTDQEQLYQCWFTNVSTHWGVVKMAYMRLSACSVLSDTLPSCMSDTASENSPVYCDSQSQCNIYFVSPTRAAAALLTRPIRREHTFTLQPIRTSSITQTFKQCVSAVLAKLV